MLGVLYLIVEEGNSLSEVLGSFQENVSGFSELNIDLLKMVKVGFYDLMIVLDDRILVNVLQMLVKVFLFDDNLGNVLMEVEVMCVVDIVFCNECVIEDISEFIVFFILGMSLFYD